VEAGDLLGDIATGSGESRLKRGTPAPSRIPIAYRVEDRRRDADLYWPGERARAALVLVPGAAPRGKDDPRLVALASTLARSRFLVLVPDIEAVRALKISAADSVEIADGVRYLGENWTPAKESSVGLVAISYAVGPAILAALTPEARQRVRFIVGVGGYYDVVAAITFFTTGHYRPAPGEPWRYRRPNEYGKWIFARSNAERLSDPADRRLLFELAERKLAQPLADVSFLAARLGPDGASIYRLLVNADPESTAALVAALPAALRSEIEALDLRRRDLSMLEAHLILVHGRDDAIIPYTESVDLAAAVPGIASLYVVDSLAHVDLAPPGAGDMLLLWQAAYQLLKERDAMPAPIMPRRADDDP
jgi:hypothetical protein